MFSYYLLRRDTVKEPGFCLKIKKFQEIQDSWIQDKKYNVKKNKISYSENQDKTRNAL